MDAARLPIARRTAACLLACASALGASETPGEFPRLVDDRLEISLYAADPDIVTPIGAAVDATGRLFVIESHTHLPPADYPGPKLDRIKIFEGRRPDGRAERVSVFADDVDEGNNLAFAPDGTLYVCAAKSVFALHDRDRDGRSEGRTTVLELDTAQTYPHNQLLALTFSVDGWLYVSRGNVGGVAYAWVGADGRRLEGYGDGGDVVRCRLDGTGLERVATGFWNAFDLRFDARGRLLLVDNDPDSRGPNRLVHVVMGGDYGYRSLYGGGGIHPYQAWEGELPGTLPYVAGVGEAPSGVLDAGRAALPEDYRDTVLVTVWGEHNVSLVRLRPDGVSLSGRAEPFLHGGSDFRPVALAPAPDGSVFLTDWMLKDYPNHGRGRIWRISTKAGIATMPPRPPWTLPEPDADRARLESVLSLSASPTPAIGELRTALASPDPFLRNAAVTVLAGAPFHEDAKRELDNPDARVRLGALLALRRADVDEPAALLVPRLQDPDLEVRLAALLWTGEKVLKTLLPAAAQAVEHPALDPRLFEVWLATMQILHSDVEKLYAARTPGGRIPRRPEPGFLKSLAADPDRPPALRALALFRLSDPSEPETRDLLLRLATGADPVLREAAVRVSTVARDPVAAPVLRKLALDPSLSPATRADALAGVGLSADESLLPLLVDPSREVRIQAVRTLRFAAGQPAVGPALERRLATAEDEATASDLRFALGREDPASRPGSLEAWRERLASGGDIAAGRRAYLSPVGACVLCHRIDGQGGAIGPDLTVIGRTADRGQLLRSIIHPSDDVAPQFQGWEILTNDGRSIVGLQGHYRTAGGATILGLDGREVNVGEDELKVMRALPESLMPAGLHAVYSVEEFRDLIAYLESLR